MQQQLAQLEPIISNVGTSIIKYPENVKLMYSYRLKSRFMVNYLEGLEVYLKQSVEKIEDAKLKNYMEDWVEAVEKLKKHPFDQKYWSNYFVAYQRVIDTSDGLLNDMIPGLETQISDEITAESCTYLIQSIVMVRDVFSFFYKFADIAKKTGLMITPKRLDVFEKLMESFFDFGSYTNELAKYVDEKKELTEEFRESLTDSFSSLNMALLAAKSAINISIEEVVITREAEVILSGYSEPLFA
jgi:hypothetical protein